MTSHEMGINVFAVCLSCKKLHKDYTVRGADETDVCIAKSHNVILLETDRDYSRLNDGDVKQLMSR